MKKRQLNYDWLRIIASFMIVFLHVSAADWGILAPTTSQWKVLNFYDVMVRSAVPVFFMLSGYFFLSKEITLSKLFKNNIFRLLLVYLIWLLLYALDHVGVRALLSFEGIKSILSTMLFKEKFHLWFLPALIALYLMTPLLRCIVKYENGLYLKYACGMFLVFGILKETLSIIPISPQAMDVVVNKIPYPLAGYCGYFLLGYYLAHYNGKFLRCRYLIMIFLGLSFLSAKLCELDAIAKGYPSDLLYGNFTLPVFLQAVILFMVCKRLDFDRLKIKNTSIMMLSSCTFGIYLIHPFIIEHLIFWFDIYPTKYQPLWFVPVLSIFVFLISLLIVMILKKLPFIKRWMI